MSRIFKIHPSIGVARVGNHPTAFFVGPETPDAVGVEIAADGSESTVTRYKQDGMVKRQGARFRVFEYESDDAGNLRLIGEVSGGSATIEWRVDLVNRKAALDRFPGDGHPAAPRNMTVTNRPSLIVRDTRPRTIAGANQSGAAIEGRFLGEPVRLGELQTDASGRLIVLGGHGRSFGVPDTPGGPIPPLLEFANNDGWCDDVSDGPVTATVTFPGQTPITVHQPAWLVVGPPDYAPNVGGGIVTLHDVAMEAAIQSGMLTAAARPSFRRDVLPILERAVTLRWSHNFNRWNAFVPLDLAALADPGPGGAAKRAAFGARIKSPGLRNYVMPKFLKKYVDQWIAGDFTSDLPSPAPTFSAAEALDRAALGACVGAGFFPGIEASITLQDKDVYVEPFRLNHAAVAKVFPGCLSEIMALPWQADFIECDQGEWWPSQRPDIAMLNASQIPGSQAEWANPLQLTDHQGMVDHWNQLGFIVPMQAAGQTVFVEAERDAAFPRV